MVRNFEMHVYNTDKESSWLTLHMQCCKIDKKDINDIQVSIGDYENYKPFY